MIRRAAFQTKGAITAATLLAMALTPSVTQASADALRDKSDLFLTRHLTETRTQTGWAEVIVQADGGFTPTREAQVRALGGYVYRHLDLIHAAAVRIPRKNMERLAALPFVKRLSTDTPVRKNDEFITEHSGAADAYGDYGLTGRGVAVAVIDSGIREHKDLYDGALLFPASRIATHVNFSGEPYAKDYTLLGASGPGHDPLGHGTHVAGIVAGNGTSSKGLGFYRTFYGVARQARLVDVRVLDSQGNGPVSGVIQGLSWVIANKNKYNIRVINLSLGHPVFESYATDPLCQAVEKAWKAGIVVVCSAGNDGRLNYDPTPGKENEGFGTAYGTILSPGNSPYAITVGAMKQTGDGRRINDQVATYSSRGPSRLDMIIKPDILAPGNKVISLESGGTATLSTEFDGTNQITASEYVFLNRLLSDKNTESTRYFRLSGTSMAAPVVAGAAALLLQKYPQVSPDTVKARLMLSADKWAFPNGTTDILTFGAGYLDIPGALANTTVVPTGTFALSPPLIVGADGYLYVDLQTGMWGPAGLWGTGVTDTRAIWGGAAIEYGTPNRVMDNRAIWGGAAQVNENRAIWGGAEQDAARVDLSSKAIFGEK